MHTIEIWSKTRFRKDAVAERNKEAYEQLRRRAVATGDEMPPYFFAACDLKSGQGSFCVLSNRTFAGVV